ncbi:GntR family transcriptional regulator [Mesorhizobium xinjiangense]|uniref:GntR family transcriptional regulator n=1 Tax=Mesorhizobium xinjiangense TaxID=2678685 RepID=UPI001F381B66|nr:GntR family transcriptional regulator [Mesorhizobium xinjiangense]
MTSQEYAYARLRHSLMIGAIAPGRAITIRGLVEALEVSPTPVREALRRLSSEHAVTVLENRRIMVPEMNGRRFEELVALRCTLECHAAERALPYISEPLIDDLSRIDARIDEALNVPDHETSVLLNQRFHTGIYSAHPEQIVMPMVESLWLQLGPFQRIAANYVGDYYRVDRHQEILKALRNRDPIALTMAVEADIRDGVGRLGREAMRRILGSEPSHDAA